VPWKEEFYRWSSGTMNLNILGIFNFFLSRSWNTWAQSEKIYHQKTHLPHCIYFIHFLNITKCHEKKSFKEEHGGGGRGINGFLGGFGIFPQAKNTCLLNYHNSKKILSSFSLQKNKGAWVYSLCGHNFVRLGCSIFSY